VSAGPNGFVDRVHRFDLAVDEWLSSVRSPAMDAVFYGLSSAADHGILWGVLGAARAARRGDPRFAGRFAAMLAAESALTNVAVKSLFRRVRPSEHFTHSNPLPYGMRRPITSSFPSGHAVTAFCAATVLGRGTSAAPLYYGLSTLVAASRVYVRMHHASDVVVGAAIGLALGHVARRVMSPLP